MLEDELRASKWAQDSYSEKVTYFFNLVSRSHVFLIANYEGRSTLVSGLHSWDSTQRFNQMWYHSWKLWSRIREVPRWSSAMPRPFPWWPGDESVNWYFCTLDFAITPLYWFVAVYQRHDKSCVGNLSIDSPLPDAKLWTLGGESTTLHKYLEGISGKV